MENVKITCFNCGDLFAENSAAYDDGKKAVCQPCADKVDAKRYRWLRSRDVDCIQKGGVFAGKTPENLVLTGHDLDRTIDRHAAYQRIN